LRKRKSTNSSTVTSRQTSSGCGGVVATRRGWSGSSTVGPSGKNRAPRPFRSPGEKMLAIDRLIHTFHWELVSEPGRSAARELIYAKNTTELLTFLDRLTYGEQSTPGLGENKAEWDRKLERVRPGTG
jgi:hypothetical protein